jgi:hypothetical protein
MTDQHLLPTLPHHKNAEAQATIDSIFPLMPWWLERFAANVQAGQPQFTHPEM